MNGLHSCKPGNEPQVGQVKTFVVINNPANGGKKAWTKIKSASAEHGGTPFRITAVKPTGFTDSYGNVSFNLDIEPADGASTPPQSSPYQQSAPKDPRGNGGGKEGYWERKEAADIAKQPRIERQHAQEMALRWFTLVKDIPTAEKITTEKLRAMIDWFQRDVGHVPSAPISKTQDDGPGVPPNDDEPF